MNPTQRHNIYVLIHKALRACMSDALVAVGRMDPHDADEVAATAALVRELLQFAHIHLQAEEDWIHPALEMRRAGSSAETRADHLQHRETENHATLIECYSEEEIGAIEGSIVGSHTPAETAMAMRWMLPAVNAPERAALLAGMRQNAPRSALDATLAAVRPHLGARDWAKLEAAIGPLAAGNDHAVQPRLQVVEVDPA